MFFAVMMEIGIIGSIIGGICMGIGKLPILKKTHERNVAMKEQKKLEKKNKKKKS